MKASLIALALAAALPMSAQAAESELSYTYVEGNYVNIDGDADGFGVKGSFNFGDSDFYGFGGYTDVEIDNTSIDLQATDVGVGYHYALSDRADLIAELAYVDLDTDFGDANGYRTSVGVRGAFTDKVEGLFKVNYTDGSDFSGDFTGTAGLQFNINQTWGITGEVEFDDNSNHAYTAGLRASF